MIPTLLLPGLLLGAVPPTARHRWRFVAAMVLLLSVAWGLLIAGDADDATQPSGTLMVGATALGAANLLVGLAVGLVIATVCRWVLRLAG